MKIGSTAHGIPYERTRRASVCNIICENALQDTGVDRARYCCGKPSCKCNGDYRHGPYAYLYWRDDLGKAHRVYVR